MRRKSTGKRLRFEVFKRDHFTCQYCGAQPPDIVLVVDHVIAVADGGETTMDNLLAACEPCNQGKADRPLGARAIRPDADLRYLEAQQEIAELQRYMVTKAQLDAEISKVVEALQDDWCEVSGLEWSPADRIVRQLLDRYSPEIVERAMREAASKVADGYLPAAGRRWVAYLFATARTMAQEYEYVDDVGTTG